MTETPATEAPEKTTRVVVVVDIHSQLAPSVEAAAAMAGAHRAGLYGMCVEDPDLAQTAGLPFTQEVTLLGGRVRQLEGRQLRHSLERFQARFAALLAEHADRLSIPWSVTTVSGQRQVLEQSGQTGADLVILGQRGKAALARQMPLRILVLGSEQASVLTTLKALLKPQEQRNTEILVLENGNQSHEQSRGVAAQFRDMPHTVVRPIAWPDVSQRRTLDSLRVQYVIAPRNGNPEQLEQILRWVSCPVILTS